MTLDAQLRDQLAPAPGPSYVPLDRAKVAVLAMLDFAIELERPQPYASTTVGRAFAKEIRTRIARAMELI